MEQLREPMGRQLELVAHPKSVRLPLQDITPENFEKLVARLANCAPSAMFRAQRIGKSGSAQSGIDVQCRVFDSDRFDCYEAKRVVEIRRGTLKKWVGSFLEGTHADTAASFHLCTTYAVSDETALQEEWKDCERLLLDRQIHPHLWDRAVLNDLLREQWQIVAELYGEGVANGFCVSAAPPLPVPQESSFAIRKETLYGPSLQLQNRSIACSVHLPERLDRQLSAALSFSRADISGISIALSSRELLGWAHWRVHADASMERPYAIPHANRAGAFLLMGRHARLSLNEAEVADLDWILERAWKHIHQACLAYVSAFRSFDFELIQHHPSAVGLISVKPWLWAQMLAFARIHDTARGDGPWHVFDASRSLLKIYTCRDGERFDQGYHAIMYAYSEGVMWSDTRSNITIGWSPTDPRTACSVRRQWDARFTHDWLLQELIPEVIRWVGSEEKRGAAAAWWRMPSRSAQTLPPQVSDLAHSLAREGKMDAWTDAASDTLQAHVGVLQSHFTCQASKAPLGLECMRNVLDCIDCALPFSRLPTEGYLRGSLGLNDAGDLAKAIRNKASTLEAGVDCSAMDFALRGLLEVLCYAPSLPMSNR
ncbi:hypothetical protein ACFVHT_23195, partial [Bacillus subtilis]